MKVDSGQNSIANFVQKTYEILNNNQFNKIIHWSGNGKQFTIRDIQQFQETILPKYFRHRNINSFIRQLNMYGFHKSRKQPTKNIFSHPYFVKDRMEILQKVKRKIKNEETCDIRINDIEDQPRIQEQLTPIKSSQLPSIASLPIRSYIQIEKQFSPLNSLISKSSIMDINPQLCLRMRENLFLKDDIERDDDDISIADQIKKEREAFINRTQGISIVKTSNFLEQFDF